MLHMNHNDEHPGHVKWKRKQTTCTYYKHLLIKPLLHLLSWNLSGTTKNGLNLLKDFAPATISAGMLYKIILVRYPHVHTVHVHEIPGQSQQTRNTVNQSELLFTYTYINQNPLNWLVIIVWVSSEIPSKEVHI